MHEVSVINSLLKLVFENCTKNKISKVSKVYLQIGEFTSVEEGSLIESFNSQKEGTICSFATLIVDRIGSMAYCENCDFDFPISYMRKECPNCGRESSNLVSGYEILLSKIEGE